MTMSKPSADQIRAHAADILGKPLRIAPMRDDEISDDMREVVAPPKGFGTPRELPDATWAVLASTLDDAQLIELPLFVGIYQATAYLQNALRVPLRPRNSGLTARGREPSMHKSGLPAAAPSIGE